MWVKIHQGSHLRAMLAEACVDMAWGGYPDSFVWFVLWQEECAVSRCKVWTAGHSLSLLVSRAGRDLTSNPSVNEKDVETVYLWVQRHEVGSDGETELTAGHGGFWQEWLPEGKRSRWSGCLCALCGFCLPSCWNLWVLWLISVGFHRGMEV